MPSIQAIINRQLRRWEHEHRRVPPGEPAPQPDADFQPIITISRQHGGHGEELAARLAESFGYTLLDRNVIDRISESTGSTRRLIAALDEHSRSEISCWVDAMLSGTDFLDESDYVAGLFRTVQSIARLGGVVVVGRGANFIIGPEGGAHLRLVSPRDERIRSLARRTGMAEEAAAREVDQVDQERSRFTRKLFHRSVDDPLAYDLILNESGRPFQAILSIAKHAANEKLARLRAAHARTRATSGRA